MNKLSKITAAALLTASLGTVANASNTPTTSINATVNVIAALTVTPDHALDFGQIATTDNTDVVVAAPTACDKATNDTAGLGNAQITNATGGQIIKVTTTFPTTLDDGSGNSIPLTAGSGSATFCKDDGDTVLDVTAAGTEATLVDDGGGNQNIIYVGATLAPDGTQQVGTYTGVVSLDIEY